MDNQHLKHTVRVQLLKGNVAYRTKYFCTYNNFRTQVTKLPNSRITIIIL